MKKFYFVILSIFLSTSFMQNSYAEGIGPIKISKGFETVQNPDWGGDVLITAEEPLGSISGVARPNGTIYVAVPDTTTVPGSCLLIYRSTNFGDNWVRIPDAIGPSAVVKKTRMVRTGADSIYVVFQIGTTLYYWNFESGNFQTHTLDVVGDYDVGTTSSSVMYLAINVEGGNQIRRHATLNGGATFSQTAIITSAGRTPRVASSLTGDSVIINYYGPVLSPVEISTIRSAIYRETAPGTFAASNFIDVVLAGPTRTEFMSVANAGRVMFFYAEGAPGSRDIKGMVSNNGGVSYTTPFVLAENPNIDEYWIAANTYAVSPSGFDIAYYSDSNGASISSDKIIYTSSTITTPTTFFTPAIISQTYYPQSSPNDYKPQVIEFYNPTGEMGIVWVGVDGASRKVYWNRLGQTTNVNNISNEVADAYELHQNYPNPFNPVTNIKFSIVESGLVSLKVYDVLGKEVAVLLNENKQAGVYEYQFDASRLSSGIYFYTLQSGDFIQTKRMTLVK